MMINNSIVMSYLQPALSTGCIFYTLKYQSSGSPKNRMLCIICTLQLIKITLGTVKYFFQNFHACRYWYFIGRYVGILKYPRLFNLLQLCRQGWFTKVGCALICNGLEQLCTWYLHAEAAAYRCSSYIDAFACHFITLAPTLAIYMGRPWTTHSLWRYVVSSST